MGLGFTKIGIGQSKHGTAVPERRNRMAEWISVKDRLPESDQIVLVVASGKPHKNITLENAIELAEYDPVGWILEMWPEWMGAKVTHWMPLPEPPSECGDTKIKTVPGHGELSNDQADNMAAYIDHQMQRVNCIENKVLNNE